MRIPVQLIRLVAREQHLSWVLLSAALTVAIVAVVAVVQWSQRRRQRPTGSGKTSGGRTTGAGYVLYQYPRWRASPNASPFCMKLETFLRLARVPHTTQLSSSRKSHKGKMPWMSFDGEPVADSFFCVRKLVELGFDLNKNLSAEQRATCHAFERMLGENLNWAIVYERWVVHNAAFVRALIPAPAPVRWVVGWVSRRMLVNRLKAHGMGLHSHDEIMAIAKEDLGALSELLGDKKFMFGAQPTQLDASAFAWLSQLLYTRVQGELACYAQQDPACATLRAYAERMKSVAYPDWDTLVPAKPNKA